MSRRRTFFRLNMLVQLAAVLVIVVMLNLLAAEHNARHDLTQNKVFEYHERTLEILGGLDDIVYVTFYNTGEWPLNIQEQESRIRDLFEEFVQLSNHRIIFDEKNPLEGVTDPARQAELVEELRASNIPVQYFNPGNITESARMGFFSLRLEYRGRGEVIADPGSAWNLEYRVIAAINKLQTKQKQIGLLAPNPKASVETDFSHLHRALLDIGTTRRLIPYSENDYEVTSDIDLLVVVQPRAVSDATLRSIDKHVMMGKPLIYIADGLVPLPNGSQFVPNSSPMMRLSEHYGIRVRDRMVWEVSPNLSVVENLRARQGTVRVRNYYKFYARRPNFDDTSALVRGVNYVLFQFATPLTTSASKPPTVETRPLIWTSGESGVDGPFVQPRPDPNRGFDDERKESQVVVMEARGIFPAYHEAMEDPDAERPDTDGTEALRREMIEELGYSEDDGIPDQSPPDTRFVVIGGSWFLRDPNNETATTLVQNIAEQLTYNSGLAGLRTERHTRRNLRADLDDQTRQKMKMWGTAALPAAIVLISLLGLALRRPLRRRRARRLLSLTSATDRS